MHGNLKSQTEAMRYVLAHCLGLSTNLLIDILQQANLDYKRDVAHLQRRTQSEGLGFLTKTLPRMGKAIILALNGDRLSIPQFRSLYGTAIPHFLKGLLSRCFSSDGFILDDADICAITDLIQFCLVWYKLEVPYDPKIQGKVLDKFARTDASLPRSFDHLGDADVRLEPNILMVANGLIRELLLDFDPEDITPRHGPGAVATGEKPHEKMQFKRIYQTIEGVYPSSKYYFLDDKHLFDEFERYKSLEFESTPIAKVVLVPKDSRGPRLISAEPLELQFLQQGLGRKLVQRIERHRLTRGFVNFTNQEINQMLALSGSVDGSWVTLDMKDASDRVSKALVERLFQGTGLTRNLMALRSTSTILPDGRVVQMQKYAPMGSALCFPVEALCFWALAVACVHVVGGVALRYAAKSVYVYGDDIITRNGMESHLLQYFHYFGLRFNVDKCCYKGLFRESCGVDAFRGHIVTPVKVKTLPLTLKKEGVKAKRLKRVYNRKRCKSAVPQIDGAQLASWISIGNLLFQRGYYRAADYVKKHVESAIGELIPISERIPQRTELNPWEAVLRRYRHHPLELGVRVSPPSDGALCWYTRVKPPDFGPLHPNWSCLRFCTRFVQGLQRREHKVLSIMPITYIQREGNSDWSELYRHLLAGLETKPYQYAFLRRVKLKRRWTSLAY